MQLLYNNFNNVSGLTANVIIVKYIDSFLYMLSFRGDRLFTELEVEVSLS